tara:strand:+ start:79 stop:1248 length:1170 start_codon:yes stop_codon:yes gene_type:complete
MKIQNLEINKIKPYSNNPRNNKASIDKVASSIEEFGFRQPIVVDENLIILAGHTRLDASRKIGLKEVPVHIAKDLTEAQKKAFRIMDNKSSEDSSWDKDLLNLEIKDLIADDYDLNMTGFSNEEIEELSVISESILKGKTDEDSIPEPPKEPKSKLGDIYELGHHTLMCGDSISITDVDKLMDGKKADMVFTDPPYGVNYQSNMRTKSEKFDVIKNDDDFLDIVPIIEIASNGWVFIWTTWKVIDTWIEKTKGLGFMNNMIIWFKGGGGIGDLKKTFSTDYEIALVWNRGIELKGKRIGSVWNINKDGSSSYLHPTQKPVALAVEAIDKTTKNADIVLDLFGGSGSTLIACEKLARKCYMMELDPIYVDVIIERWENFTGKKAKLIDEN